VLISLVLAVFLVSASCSGDSSTSASRRSGRPRDVRDQFEAAMRKVESEKVKHPSWGKNRKERPTMLQVSESAASLAERAEEFSARVNWFAD
jgi:hypothetical protein